MPRRAAQRLMAIAKDERLTKSDTCVAFVALLVDAVRGHQAARRRVRGQGRERRNPSGNAAEGRGTGEPADHARQVVLTIPVANARKDTCQNEHRCAPRPLLPPESGPAPRPYRRGLLQGRSDIDGLRLALRDPRRYGQGEASPCALPARQPSSRFRPEARVPGRSRYGSKAPGAAVPPRAAELNRSRLSTRRIGVACERSRGGERT